MSVDTARFRPSRWVQPPLQEITCVPLQAKFLLSFVGLLIHLTCEPRGKISCVKMIQVEDKPHFCAGRRWWWKSCIRKVKQQTPKMAPGASLPLTLTCESVSSWENRLRWTWRTLQVHIFMSFWLYCRRNVQQLFILLKTNSPYMLILVILLFYTSFVLFNVVLTFWTLWMNFVTVPVWLLQMQGCISFLNLVGERDQRKPDPLQMEMFWSIKPGKKKSEARAERKRGHKFWEWIV